MGNKALKVIGKSLRAVAAVFDVYDVLAVVGFAALEYGIAQWSVPAAWVVGGVCLLALAIMPRLPAKKKAVS